MKTISKAGVMIVNQGSHGKCASSGPVTAREALKHRNDVVTLHHIQKLSENIFRTLRSEIDEM